MMRIVFFGTPAFATPFLRELILDEQIEVVGVVTQPDKPAGRGADVTPPPVKVMAEDALIPYFQPASLKTDEHIGTILSDLNADVFVVVAYGKMIPSSILTIPAHGCVNVHPSLLPKHRGPSPMQWAIADGDVTTGVSIMVLDEGMDTGPLLAMEHLTLDADETYDSLVTKVHNTGPRLLVSTLKRYVRGKIIPVEQDHTQSTLTRLLDKEDGHVDWSHPMAQIERRHRAYSEWPGSWTCWERKKNVCLRLKLINLHPVDFNADLPNGMVSIKENRLFIDCQDGTLEVTEIQPEGKPKMTASAFIAGYRDIHGCIMQ